jgi:hypothetical protein
MQPMVRVRFLVALVVLFGVLASVAGAVAVVKAREVDDLEARLHAHDVVHQADWPDGYTLSTAASGCVAGADAVCVVTDDEPADAARTVSEVLPVRPTGTDERTTNQSTRHLLDGRLGEQLVLVEVQQRRVDERPTGHHDYEGATISIGLYDEDELD